jgi:hypothetical protein
MIKSSAMDDDTPYIPEDVDGGPIGSSLLEIEIVFTKE